MPSSYCTTTTTRTAITAAIILQQYATISHAYQFVPVAPSLSPSLSLRSSSVLHISTSNAKNRLPTFQSPRQRRASQRTSTLSMHMGHSHSHHHHGHSHDKSSKASSNISAIQVSPRGLLTRILFAMVSVLGPPLLLHRTITRKNMALFALVTMTLTLANRIRTEIKGVVDKAKQFRDGFLKHAPRIAVATSSGDSGASGTASFRNDNAKAADRVTLLGVVVNLALSIGKAIIGVTCHSSALVADAGHSLSDLFSDFITLWAVQIARLPPDDDHPYGHGKFEAVGSLFLALTLFATGLSVGASSNAKLMHLFSSKGSAASIAAANVSMPTWPALVMAFASIVSKEWLYRITKRVGEDLNSQVVIANAWHHRSDAYSSILALGSIGLAMSVPGMLFCDSAAGLLVGGMICMTGAEIMGEAVNQLTDTSDSDLVKRVESLVQQSQEEIEIKRIRARWMGSSAIVDLSLTTETLSSSALRAVEEQIRHIIMSNEPGIIDAEVHATSRAVVCPLLTAKRVEGDGKSPHEVEEDARGLLLQHSEVKSVEDCTVHYEDTVLVNLSVKIQLENQEATIKDASHTALELKALLEETEEINKASIYLDLNSMSALPMMPIS